jgi:8-oxo-dGTP pyrophosphatase MutT (NUDIX family)
VTDTSSGVAVVVWRKVPRLEVLLLHRRVFGESFAGDWAWTTPGGAREPGESAVETAQRELFEETGLRLECVPVASPYAAAPPGFDVDAFAAEARADDLVTLSEEHDRYAWVQPEKLDRCRPAWVSAMYLAALEFTGQI